MYLKQSSSSSCRCSGGSDATRRMDSAALDSLRAWTGLPYYGNSAASLAHGSSMALGSSVALSSSVAGTSEPRGVSEPALSATSMPLSRTATVDSATAGEVMLSTQSCPAPGQPGPAADGVGALGGVLASGSPRFSGEILAAGQSCPAGSQAAAPQAAAGQLPRASSSADDAQSLSPTASSPAVTPAARTGSLHSAFARHVSSLNRPCPRAFQELYQISRIDDV